MLSKVLVLTSFVARRTGLDALLIHLSHHFRNLLTLILFVCLLNYITWISKQIS